MPLVQSFAQIGNYSVQLDVASPAGTHNTMVYFEDSVSWTTDVPTFGWDGCCDALFIPGSTPVSFLYTEIIEPDFPVNNQISINGMPPLTGSYSVPVNLIVGTSGNHTIVASLDQIPVGMTVELQDLVLGEIQDLLDSNLYYFQANVGDAVDRFILHFNMFLVSTETAEQNTWNLYPTVTTDELSITGIESDQPATADIYSLSGQLLKTTTLNQNRTFSLEGLDSGLYLVRLSSPDRSHTFRIIKQ